MGSDTPPEFDFVESFCFSLGAAAIFDRTRLRRILCVSPSASAEPRFAIDSTFVGP